MQFVLLLLPGTAFEVGQVPFPGRCLKMTEIIAQLMVKAFVILIRGSWLKQGQELRMLGAFDYELPIPQALMDAYLSAKVQDHPQCQVSHGCLHSSPPSFLHYGPCGFE